MQCSLTIASWLGQRHKHRRWGLRRDKCYIILYTKEWIHWCYHAKPTVEYLDIRCHRDHKHRWLRSRILAIRCPPKKQRFSELELAGFPRCFRGKCTPRPLLRRTGRPLRDLCKGGTFVTAPERNIYAPPNVSWSTSPMAATAKPNWEPATVLPSMHFGVLAAKLCCLFIKWYHNYS